MAIADVLAAFNTAAAPSLTASQAMMDMDRSTGRECSVLTFIGMRQDGTPFEIKSELIPPRKDPIIAARETAASLLRGSA